MRSRLVKSQGMISYNKASCFQATRMRRSSRGERVVEQPSESTRATVGGQTVVFDGSIVEYGTNSADASLHALMRHALEVPAAAIALIEAFAAQSRALRLIQEADARGAASLPPELRHRVADVTERSAAWLSGGDGVRA